MVWFFWKSRNVFQSFHADYYCLQNEQEQACKEREEELAKRALEHEEALQAAKTREAELETGNTFFSYCNYITFCHCFLTGNVIFFLFLLIWARAEANEDVLAKVRELEEERERAKKDAEDRHQLLVEAGNQSQARERMLMEEKDRAAKESNQVLTKLTWEKERAARDALNHETYLTTFLLLPTFVFRSQSASTENQVVSMNLLVVSLNFCFAVLHSLDG